MRDDCKISKFFPFLSEKLRNADHAFFQTLESEIIQNFWENKKRD